MTGPWDRAGGPGPVTVTFDGADWDAALFYAGAQGVQQQLMPDKTHWLALAFWPVLGLSSALAIVVAVAAFSEASVADLFYATILAVVPMAAVLLHAWGLGEMQRDSYADGLRARMAKGGERTITLGPDGVAVADAHVRASHAWGSLIYGRRQADGLVLCFLHDTIVIPASAYRPNAGRIKAALQAYGPEAGVKGIFA